MPFVVTSLPAGSEMTICRWLTAPAVKAVGVKVCGVASANAEVVASATVDVPEQLPAVQATVHLLTVICKPAVPFVVSAVEGEADKPSVMDAASNVPPLVRIT